MGRLLIFLGSNEGKEHVEGNLHTVDEDKTVLGGDELEVDSVDNGPDLPWSLAGTEKVVLDFASDSGQWVTVDQSEVEEEDTHEDGAEREVSKGGSIGEICTLSPHRTKHTESQYVPPHSLINGNLEGDMLGFSSGNLAVEPVVEVVSRRSVVDETEEGKSQETLHVEWSSTDEDLRLFDPSKQWKS